MRENNTITNDIAKETLTKATEERVNAIITNENNVGIVKTNLRSNNGIKRCLQCFTDVTKESAIDRMEIWACGTLPNIYYDIYVGRNTISNENIATAFETIKEHKSKIYYTTDKATQEKIVKEYYYTKIYSDKLDEFLTALLHDKATEEQKTEEAIEKKTEEKKTTKRARKTAKATTKKA